MNKNIKKTLKIVGLLFIALAIIQIAVFARNVYSIQAGTLKITYTWLNYMLDITQFLLSLVSGIIYLVQLKKSQKDILKQNRLFFVLAIANVFNSIFGWVLSFWAQIAVENLKGPEFSYVKVFPDSNATNLDKESSTPHIDENGNIVIDESGYEVLHTETLTSRLNELDKLFEKKQITKEEYNKLRQEAIDTFLN